jgi:hypothetical protein
MVWRIQGFDRDGFSIAGVLPTSDANGYFTGAIKILYGQDISSFAARRPLFVTFLSVILFLTGQNLALSLIVLAALTAVAILLLASEVRNSFGVLPAALVALLMVYCYSGRFAGKFLTEQLGIPLGMLSLCMLLRAIRQNQFQLAAWGLFILTIALNARAGAMFVLPVLILWRVTQTGRSKLAVKQFFILCGIVGLGFLINYWVLRSVSDPTNIPFANFGSTLYGIATGYRGWRAWYQDYPGGSEAEAFKISLTIIKDSPMLFLTGIFRAYRAFLQPQYFFSFLYLPDSQLTPAAYLLSALTVIGVWRLVKNRHQPFSRMMLFVLAGILLSVPFAPPSDDAIRAMTATTSYLALLAGSAFIHFQVDTSSENPSVSLSGSDRYAIYFSGLLILITIAGWVFLRGALQVPAQRAACNPDEQPITMTITGTSYINIVKNNQQDMSFLPNIRKADSLKNLSSFPTRDIWNILRKMTPDQTLIFGLNFAGEQPDSKPIWLVVPTSSVQNFNGPNTFCATKAKLPRLENGDFFVGRGVDDVFSSR